MATNSVNPVSFTRTLGLMDLPLGELSVSDLDFIERIFIEKVKVKAESGKAMGHATKAYLNAQDIANTFLSGLRAIRKLTEVWHSVNLTATNALNVTKFAAILSLPADALEVVDEVKATVHAKSGFEGAAHGSAAAAAGFNAVGNVWTFVAGLDYVVKVSTPVMNFLDIAGPVTWALSAVGLVHTGYKYHTVEKVSDGIAETKKGGITEISRLKLFQFILNKENGERAKQSDIMSKLHLTDRMPLFESKCKVRNKIETIAKNYFSTGNKKYTNEFGKLVNKQMKMTRLFLGIKSAATVAGVAASLFFFLPGLKNYPHVAWALMILSSSMTLSYVLFSKINSRMWVKELDKLSKESSEEAKKAQEAYANWIDAKLKEADEELTNVNAELAKYDHVA